MFVVRVPYERRASWEAKFLLSSDRHWDNPHSDREMQKSHLEEAKRVGAGIIDVGDLFCAMQGKYDPRASKKDVRDEHNVSSYLDALVNTASEWFAPYAGNFICIGQGNHETSILKHQETDLTERLVHSLREKTGADVHNGHYGGYVRFNFQSDRERDRQSVTLKYYHGHGGGGEVTKGLIQANRRAVIYPDADIIATGHVHEMWVMEQGRERLSQHGKVYDSVQTHVCLGTYKNEHNGGKGGYHTEKGRGPRPRGAYWLTYRWGGARYGGRMLYELTRAI